MVQFGSKQTTAPAPPTEEVNRPREAPAQKVRANAGVVFGLLSGVFLASALLPLPANNGLIAHIPAFCPFYRMTGLPCPGCGLTRAFVCISHGQFAQSLHWHPIGWLVYVVFAFLWARAGLALLLGRELMPISLRAQNRLGMASFALVLLVGFARIGWLLAHHAHYA